MRNILGFEFGVVETPSGDYAAVCYGRVEYSGTREEAEATVEAAIRRAEIHIAASEAA